MQDTERARERLNWDDVRFFLALHRSRTVAEAAARVGVDASTVSRRLTTLEEALGSRLFDRGRDGIAPMKSADDLLPVAEEVEAGMDRFAHAADALEREVKGDVRITCPPDVADIVVMPLLTELLQEHPELRVTVDPGEGLVDLSRRQADLALRTVRPRHGDLVVTRLTRIRWVLVASRALADEIGTVRSFAEVPWIGWGERMSEIAAARWLAKYARETTPRVRSDSLTVQLAALSRGLGVALVPAPSVEHYGLVPLRVAPSLREAAAEWPEDDLYLVTHRSLRAVPRVQVVWELIVSRLGPRGK